MSGEDTSKNKRKPDYTKGKIYIIRNTQNISTYIGSTCRTLAQRMGQHRRDMKNPKRQHYKLYQAMNELGVDAFYIELLEDYPCQKQEELLKKEGERIREYQSDMNKVINGRTQKEYKKDNKEKIEQYQRLYNQNNRDKRANNKKAHYNLNRHTILEKNKQYYRENKERRRQYYDKNKKRINERMRQHNDKNKEKNNEYMRQYMRQYREKNKDKIEERQRQLRNEKKQKATDIEILE